MSSPELRPSPRNPLEEPDVGQGGPQQVIVNIVRGEANAMATTLASGPGGDDAEP